MKKRIFLTLLLCSLLLPLMADNLITATGTVTDETGEALIGCTVQMKGSQVGTITDLDGRFKIQVPPKATLVFSFIGYKTQEVVASASMKIVMKDDSHVLNEVVAVGYGTMKRSDITGSVVSVKAEDMQQTSAATMDQMLQGRAAGMRDSERRLGHGHLWCTGGQRRHHRQYEERQGGHRPEDRLQGPGGLGHAAP